MGTALQLLANGLADLHAQLSEPFRIVGTDVRFRGIRAITSRPDGLGGVVMVSDLLLQRQELEALPEVGSVIVQTDTREAFRLAAIRSGSPGQIILSVESEIR